MYVVIAFVAAKNSKQVLKLYLSWARRRWTPIGLISSRLEELETPVYDVITSIENIRQMPEEFPMPLECSRGYLERLRRDRNK